MKYRYWLMVFIGLLCVSTPSFSGETLKLEADYWMPYTGDGHAEVGYAVELVKAIFKKQGIRVVYQEVPWARAISDARDGKCDGVIGAMVSEVPGFVLPHEVIGRSVQEFYVKRGSAWKYTGIESVKGIRLGVIKNYSYFPGLDAYINTNSNQIHFGFGDHPMTDSLIPMLIRGRIDAVIDDRAVIRYDLKRMGLDREFVAAGIGDEVQNSYIAFAPGNAKSPQYARMLSAGIIALRKTGELKKILSHYGLSDWERGGAS